MSSTRRELGLARRLDQLIAARRWPRKARILRRHPELLGVDALRLLDAGDGDVRRLHAVLLRRAGDVGSDRAVVEIRAAVELLPQLVEDGAAALRRYRLDGADDELAAAVEAFDAAVALAVPGFPDRGPALANLGLALRDRFEAGGAEADLRRAVDVLEEAVLISAAEPDLHARRAALVNLGSVLLTRLEAGGPEADLDRALDVVARADALPLGTDGERVAMLTTVGEAWLQCHLRGRPPALDAAVAAFTEAVELAGEQPARQWSNLGVALTERYLARGELDDLERAAALLGDSVAATPEASPELPGLRANVGSVLAERYRRSGDPHDLDAAVGALDAALAATDPRAPDRPNWRYNLALALRDRYERDGDLAELGRAVTHLEVVVTATPTGSALRPARLDQLAVTLRERALRRGDAGELERAVQLHREAVPDGDVAARERAALWGNLGGTLRAWAAATGATRPLEEALDAYRAALAAAPPGDAAHAATLTNLGNGLVDHYDVTGQPGSLDEAMRVYDAAVAATDPSSPELPGRQHNRAGALRRRHRRDGHVADLAAAVAAYREGCRLAVGVTAEVGLRCGLGWGEWAGRRQAWSEATEAFDVVAAAADQLVRRQLSRRDKEVWLLAVAAMPAPAALALCGVGKPEPALARLEWGRARLLADALGRDRADLTVLSRIRPELADRYRLAAGRVLAAESAAARD